MINLSYITYLHISKALFHYLISGLHDFGSIGGDSEENRVYCHER